MECLVDLASKSSGVAASSFSQNFDAVISDYFTTPSATPSATSSGTSSATSSGTSSKSSSLQQKFCSLFDFSSSRIWSTFFTSMTAVQGGVKTKKYIKIYKHNLGVFNEKHTKKKQVMDSPRQTKN